jgi:hypothetical protein
MQIKWRPKVGFVLGLEEIRTLGEERTILALSPETFEVVPTTYVFSRTGSDYAWVRKDLAHS